MPKPGVRGGTLLARKRTGVWRSSELIPWDSNPGACLKELPSPIPTPKYTLSSEDNGRQDGPSTILCALLQGGELMAGA